jgi:hypothetical protein
MIKIINKSLFLLVFCFIFFLLTNTVKAECQWVEGVERSGGSLGNGRVVSCNIGDVESATSQCQEEATNPTPNFYDTYIDEYQRRIWICCCAKEVEEIEEEVDGFIPQITIPGSDFIKGQTVKMSPSTKTLAEYIKAVYNYMLAVVGLLAAVVIMIGGVVWLTAAGNTERISQAKSWITGSLVGLILALTSFLLLRIINPNLVDFRITEIETIRPIESGCCVSEKSQDKALLTTSVSCYETLVTNGEIATVSDEVLDEKYEGSYAKYLNLTGKFFAGYIIKDLKCIKLTEEEIAKNKVYCSGKDWGENCESGDWTNEGYVKCKCFNEQAYYYRDGEYARLGDPCGNDYNSRCVAKDRCENRDNGGVSCYSGQTCCLSSAIRTIDDSVCEGVSYGGKCKNEDDCYCFNGKPKIGKGGLGEECGIYSKSKCMEGSLSCPSGYSHDGTSDTRSCITGYRCCFPN